MEGKAEAVINVLEELADVPEQLREAVMSEKSLTTLDKWLKLAAKSDSIEQFINEM